MVTEEQAIAIASRLIASAVGSELRVLGAIKQDGRTAGKDDGADYWFVSFEYEPGFDPALVVSVNADTGDAAQEEVL